MEKEPSDTRHKYFHRNGIIRPQFETASGRSDKSQRRGSALALSYTSFIPV